MSVETRTGLDPWVKAELPDAPVPVGLDWLKIVGPGVIVLGLSIGGGEFLLGPTAFAASIAIYTLTLAWIFTYLPEWRYVDRVKADYVWVPKHLPVVRQMQLHGWHRMCEGSSSILLARELRRPPCSRNSSSGDRLFPQL